MTKQANEEKKDPLALTERQLDAARRDAKVSVEQTEFIVVADDAWGSLDQAASMQEKAAQKAEKIANLMESNLAFSRSKYQNPVELAKIEMWRRITKDLIETAATLRSLATQEIYKV